MSGRIDHLFAHACHIILNCKGHVVVMGVGKSGHIARKVAATFASTGTPAFFVHPGEAKHGDAGMITPSDVVLAISYSGETEEIVSILPVIRRLKIPLISMTGKCASSLARHADVNINVGIETEACPLGLAPTSSTTVALATGDAMALALLNERGFTMEDFALSHPGGTLGRRLLLTVDEIMHKGENIPRVGKEALLKTVLLEMTRKKLGMTTIVDNDGILAGVFTDGDVRRVLDTGVDIHKILIHEVMNRNPKIIPPGTLAAGALDRMKQHKITSLVVVNEQREPVGVIHMHDILRAGIA
nr:KpsF/GutQ family sugar-phosphate isomerase [Aquicella siphonis]